MLDFSYVVRFYGVIIPWKIRKNSEIKNSLNLIRKKLRKFMNFKISKKIKEHVLLHFPENCYEAVFRQHRHDRNRRASSPLRFRFSRWEFVPFGQGGLGLQISAINYSRSLEAPARTRTASSGDVCS